MLISQFAPTKSSSGDLVMIVLEVRDDPKLMGGSGEVPIYEWSGW